MGKAGIHGPPNQSEFQKGDPWTAELVQILKDMQGFTDRRFGPNIKKRNQGVHGPPIWHDFLKGERRDPRTADLVEVFKGG